MISSIFGHFKGKRIKTNVARVWLGLCLHNKLAEAQVPRDDSLSQPADVYEDGIDECVRPKSSAEARTAETLTDVCWTAGQTEVDLISLIEEQIPRYVLRADTITDFTGYENKDWVRSPCLPPDLDLNLSPFLLGETLKYFTISGERVSQMTRTYNDTEALTQLLQEKERDLELTARIGQTLLDRNQELEQSNEQLELQLAQTQEQLKQVRHELTVKESLLRIYHQDYEQDHDDSITLDTSRTSLGQTLQQSDLENFERQIHSLQSENDLLKIQSARLEEDTAFAEEKEASLLADCAVQLQQKNAQCVTLQEEVSMKTELLTRQSEEISALTTHKLTAMASNAKLTLENTELEKHLSAAMDAQRDLTAEIREWEARSEELQAMNAELREELKALQRKQKPCFIRQHHSPLSPYLPHGCLALELEDSFKRDMDYPQGFSPSERVSHTQRVMDAVKTIRESSTSSTHQLSSSTSHDTMRESGMGTSIEGDMDSAHLGPYSLLNNMSSPESGHLHTALRRLATRRANELNEQLVQESESRLRRGDEDVESPSFSGQSPDSFLSMDSNLSHCSVGKRLIPSKLQIVKPLEGSYTLHQWQRLATPNMGGVLVTRLGIQVRGDEYVVQDTSEECDLSDLEDDDPFNMALGKGVESGTGIYTYTTSKILHPTDHYTTTSVYSGSGRPSVSITPSTPDHSPQKPPKPPVREATSTFSMSQAQARGLNERGTVPRTPTTTSVTCAPQTPLPRRFPSIVTETVCSTQHSNTQAAYSTSSVFLPPVGATDQNTALAYRPENALLNLVTRIKDMGLNSIIDLASNSGVNPVKLDPTDVGFNTIMSIKKNVVVGGKRGSRDSPGVVQRPDVVPKSSHYKAPKSALYKTPKSALYRNSVTTPVTTTAVSSESSRGVLASHLGYASMPLCSTTSLTPVCSVSSSTTSLSSSAGSSLVTSSLKPRCVVKATEDMSMAKGDGIGVGGVSYPSVSQESLVNTGLGWLKKIGGNVYSAKSALMGDDQKR